MGCIHSSNYKIKGTCSPANMPSNCCFCQLDLQPHQLITSKRYWTLPVWHFNYSSISNQLDLPLEPKSSSLHLWWDPLALRLLTRWSERTNCSCCNHVIWAQAYYWWLCATQTSPPWSPTSCSMFTCTHNGVPLLRWSFLIWETTT